MASTYPADLHQHGEALVREIGRAAVELRIEVLRMVNAAQTGHPGGSFSAAEEVLAAGSPVPLERVGLRDHFATSGPCAELLELVGLTTEAVVTAATSAIARTAGPIPGRPRRSRRAPTAREG